MQPSPTTPNNANDNYMAVPSPAELIVINAAQDKLEALKARLSAARQSNHKEAVEEDRRNKLRRRPWKTRS